MAATSTYVKYNGKDLAFGGEQAAPFVSQANEYVQVGGGTWVILKKINLTGTLVACSQAELIDLINQVRDIFNEDFHDLDIQGVEKVPCIKVLGLDFGESQFLSHVNYNISLQAYDEESLASAYKVIEPTERVEFTETDAQTMQKVITVSAKGISCGSYDALSNAKSFVTAKFAEREKDIPALIASVDDHSTAGHLSSVAEEINRINGTYSLSKTFVSDLGTSREELPSEFDAAIILRYTKEPSATRGEYGSIKYTGDVSYGIDNASKSSNAHAKLEKFINEMKKIDYKLVGLEINEDKFAGVINFSFQLTEDNTDVVDDWSVTVSENSSSSLIQVSIDGLVTAKGPVECRWEKVEEYFGSDKEAKDRYFGIASSYYDEYGNFDHQHAVKDDAVLNNLCTDFQISKEKRNGEISYSFNFDNRDSKGYYSFDYTIDITPSIWRVASTPSIEGNWVMVDLGYRTRARFDIHGQFVAGDGAADLKPADIAKAKYKEYAGNINKEWYELEESSVMKGVDSKVGDNFGYGWSFLASQGATKGPGGSEYIQPLKEGLLLGNKK